MKELRNTKFYAVILISVMLIGMFSLSSAILSHMSDVIIRSSGAIAFISPLHVEGRYIKDAFGNIVYLRSFQKCELADDPDGIWMGNTMWDPGRVGNELDAMKSWGANCLRCQQAIECWKYDLSEPYAAIPNRQAIKELLTLAGERSMYVIFVPYSVKHYWNGRSQDPLPYPPYQTSPGAEDVIASEQEFVDYWISVATELKDYPNVIFQLYNEPYIQYGDELAKASWFSVAQDCIDAIRSTGATQIIVFQLNKAVWSNLDYNSGGTVEWIQECQLIDPIDNLAYSTHIYREYGGTGIYSESESQQLWDSDHGWDYEEIKRAFQISKIDWVGDALNKSLLITETGCNVALSGNELQHELDAWNNTLRIYQEWGLHCSVHWWREIGTFRIHYGPPNFTPNQGGEILIEALTGE